VGNDSETSGGTKKTESGGDPLFLQVGGSITENIHAEAYDGD